MNRPPAEEGGRVYDVYLVKLDALDRHITSEIDALRRETHLANENAQRAIAVAAHEAEERLAAHNGLIGQMRDQSQTFASGAALEDFKARVVDALDERRGAIDARVGRVESGMSRLYGGLAVVAFVGVANLVKVWTG